MKPFRNNQLYLSDEIMFFAKVLSKRLVHGTEAAITVDQFVDAELRDKWTRENPELVEAYDRHCKARQDAKKAYEKIENEAIGEVEHRQ